MSRKSNPSKAGADSKKPKSRRFLPDVLDRTVIAIPLLAWFNDPTKRQPFDIVVDLNLNYRDGLKGARKVVEDRINKIIATQQTTGRKRRMSLSVVDKDMQNESVQYVFATLYAKAIKDLAQPDSGQAPVDRAIYHIWPDFPLKSLINKSISTVKADAAHNSFAAGGAGIVWAVVDSGIDGNHPHFTKAREPRAAGAAGAPRLHGPGEPLVDVYGHGTHVAGIIAGQFDAKERQPQNKTRRIVATTRYRDHNGDPAEAEVTPALTFISGMAPSCKLLSLKVLDGSGDNGGAPPAASSPRSSTSSASTATGAVCSCTAST